MTPIEVCQGPVTNLCQYHQSKSDAVNSYLEILDTIGYNIFHDYLVTALYKQLENAQKRRNEHITFKVGDPVMYQRRSWKKNLSLKLQTIRRGPYQVTDIDKHGNLRLNIPTRYSRHLVFAPDMLKHYHVNPEHLQNFETLPDSEDIQYTIERITDHRTTKDGKLFLVHWRGYVEDENTLETAEAIEKDAPGAVNDYEDVLAELGEEPMDMDSA